MKIEKATKHGIDLIFGILYVGMIYVLATDDTKVDGATLTGYAIGFALIYLVQKVIRGIACTIASGLDGLRGDKE